MFAERASAIAGWAGAVLGWSPDQFWRCTPAELVAVLDTLTPRDAAPADAALLAAMTERFPDG
jgi:uncharacterized phage protein (TIGR02216 family)